MGCFWQRFTTKIRNNGRFMCNQVLHTELWFTTTLWYFTNNPQLIVELWASPKNQAQPMSSCLVHKIVGSRANGGPCVCTMDDEFKNIITYFTIVQALFHSFSLWKQENAEGQMSFIFSFYFHNFLSKTNSLFLKNQKEKKAEGENVEMKLFRHFKALCVFRFL